MAIYSCNLSSIGRTTHSPGTGGAHIRYITRAAANPVVMAMNMPDDRQQARNWLDSQERAMRKNGRVIDKIRIALPRELTEDQRYELVQDFMVELTDNRIPWYAAIHQTGKDAHNPHVHIAVHDRDIETGKRLLRLSDNSRDRKKAGLPGPKAVEWVRDRWEVVCNLALEQYGHDVRIDRRTLEAQGIDREPTIHEGPRAQHIDGTVKRPESRSRTNGCGRVIDYPSIDKGRTRREFNAYIIDLNLERAARSDNPASAAWAQFERGQFELDRKLEGRLVDEQRKRTEEYRKASAFFEARHKGIAAEWKLKRRTAVKSVQDKLRPKRDVLRQRQHRERQSLKGKQSRLRARILALIDITGTTRRKQEAARKELSRTHKIQRHEFREKYLSVKDGVLCRMRDRFKPQIDKIKTKRSEQLKSINSAHKKSERQTDIVRQHRETEREQFRRITEKKIANWLRERKLQSKAAKAGAEWVARIKPPPTGTHFRKVASHEPAVNKPKRDRSNDISEKTIASEFNTNSKDTRRQTERDQKQEELIRRVNELQQRKRDDPGRGR